jgi:hypothetical protein
MNNPSVSFALRSQLLASAAAVALMGLAFSAREAKAADVVCAPDASGTAIGNAAEACSGTGDKINFAAAPATVTSTVTLNGVNIAGAAGTAVAIDPGATSQTVIVSGGGSINALGGDGLRLLTATGAGALSVGTAANRIGTAITGGSGALTANGVRVEGLGDVSLFGGNVAITTTATGTGSWGLRARSLPVGSTPGGAVIVDTLGAVTGPGAIQATTTGTDATDSVTVISAGAVTGTAGAGIQVRSVNGNSAVTASGAVIGSVGTGSNGIDVAATGTGNVAVTTLGGGTVTGNGGAVGVIVSSGAGGFGVNLGANVTSTASNAIRTTNVGAAGTNTIVIGNANIRGQGTCATTGIIDMTSASGGLITLTTGAGASVFSNSATAAAQNGDLAIRGTGGRIVINNAGSLRGTMDFSGISVATNNVTVNNSSAPGWHTAGTTTFSAGNDVFNNTGLLAANGATILAFGGGNDVFNNNAGGTFLATETAGASTTTLTGLETFNNAGTISLMDGETNDVFNAGSAAYVSSGGANIGIDAFLGAGTQNSCAALTVADCVILGATSGTGTTITVNDTNSAGAAVLNANGIVIVHTASGGATEFTLAGANVANTPHGGAIEKGFIEYQLAFDAANSNVLLVSAPGVAAVEMGGVMAGMQNLWHMTAQGAEDRMDALRQTHADHADRTSVWGRLSYGEFHRDNALSVNGLSYDTSYNQTMEGIETGIDHVVSKDADSSLVLGALFAYDTSRLHFKADADKVRYTAWDFGIYASYVNGPWFANLLAKDDSTRVKFDFPNVPGIDKRDGNSFGSKLTAGGHFMADSIDLEPQASLAYVRSTLSDVDVPGTNFDFDSGTSFRGTVGVRVSTNLARETSNVQPFLFAGVGNEFDAKNTVTMTSGGSNVSIADKPIRTFAITSVGVNVFGEGGLSGFVKADGLFASHTNSFAFWAGLRFTP